MGTSKLASIVVMGILLIGLLCVMAIAFGKDRDDTRRVQAPRATFAAIDFPAAPSTAALDINSTGDIVGRYPVAGNMETHGFLRNGFGQFTTIDFPNAVFTVAAGINSRGDIVSYYCVAAPCAFTNNSQHGFLLSDHELTTTMDFPGGHVTANFGINARGDIVGTYNDDASGTAHGFLLKLEERDEDED